MFRLLTFGFNLLNLVRRENGTARLAALLLLVMVIPVLNAQAIGATAAFRQDKSSGNSTSEKVEITNLELGQAIERTLSAGENHTYQLQLTAGQFASVIIEQRGIDVIVRVSGPDGKGIAEVDAVEDNANDQNQKRVEFIAEAAGIYDLTVEVIGKEAATGHYEIRLSEWRAATEKDRLLYEAQKLEGEYNRLYMAKQYDKALTLAERTLELREKVFGPNHLKVAATLCDLGWLYYNDGQNFIRAEKAYRQALEIREQSLPPDHPTVATSLNALAVIYHMQGEDIKAEPLFQRALDIWEKALGESHPKIAKVLSSFAYLYQRRGDLERAEALERRVLEIRKKYRGPDHPDVALSLCDLARIYKDRKDYATAESLFQQALAIYERAYGPNHSQVGNVVNSLGVIYFAEREYAKAEAMFQRALSVLEAQEGPEGISVAMQFHNLGDLYRKMGDTAKAGTYLQRGLDIWEKRFGPEYRNLPLFLTSLADLYFEQGDYAKAELYLLRALSIREKWLGERNSEITATLNRLTWLCTLKGDFAQAIKYQSRANQIFERNIDLYFSIGSERQKLAYMATLFDQSNQAISLNICFTANEPSTRELAATTILQRKGRVLDNMAESLAAVRRHLGPEDQSLLDKLHDLTSQLAQLVLNGPQGQPLAMHQQRVQTVEEEREKVEAEISHRGAGFFERSQPVTLDAVQAAIPDNAALVEFATYRPYDPKAPGDRDAYGEPHYVAYVIHRQGIPEGKDLGEAKTIDGVIGALRQALRDPQRRDIQQLARAVDQRVMQPLRTLTGGATQLLISPEGALNLIPFEALVDERGNYLIERYAFSYLTSGRDLLRLRVARDSKSEPMVFADPLFGEPKTATATVATGSKIKPLLYARKRQGVTISKNLSNLYFASLSGTALESHAIKALFPEAQILEGPQATESAIKQVDAPRILHIATHGFFLEDAPVAAADSVKEPQRGIDIGARVENPLLRSGLALAGANLHGSGDDNGILTALEASGLNLWGTKLVVLSACDTGIGEVRTGEGIYGLRRAFVLAGSETLMMSLWPVSDYVTRELMAGYYKNLKQGMGRGESLRQVQLNLLRRKDRQHPFYWASFIQSGEWANLDGKR